MSDLLHRGFRAAASLYPDNRAVETVSGDYVSYAQLVSQVQVLSDHMRALDVGPGSRVAIMIPKSIAAVAAILAVLETGAAYVPIDPDSPAARAAMIIRDAMPVLVLAGNDLLPLFPQGEQVALSDNLTAVRLDWEETISVPDDLALILYTSGSTGIPKGVMLTHTNTCSFVQWCSDTFPLTGNDRVTSHAPFHFDLSVFDIFVTLGHGATLLLISASESKSPMLLAQIASKNDITVWYSTPTTLSTMALYGKMDQYRYDAIRLVLFAGEVFPIKPLAELRKHWPHATYYNLYGPTETNVCTYYKLPAAIDANQHAPFPIGEACAHCSVRIINANGESAPEGELLVTGRAVMHGYLGRPELNDHVFVNLEGKRWYRTGDIVRRRDDGLLDFVGRRDRMVKRRGYRIELGEIESVLSHHTEVAEAAVTTAADADGGVRIHAHVGWSYRQEPSLVGMKQFCAENLPMYMVPDSITFHKQLPKTSTNKVDYQALLSSP